MSEKSGLPPPGQTQPVQPQGPPVYYPPLPQGSFPAPMPQGSIPAPQQLAYYQPPNPSVQAIPQQAPAASPDTRGAVATPGAPVYAQPAYSGMPGGAVPRTSCRLYCPNCKKEVNTVINFENSAMVWIICVILCVFTACCCFIPFLINDLKDCVHYCPSCRREIARNSRN